MSKGKNFVFRRHFMNIRTQLDRIAERFIANIWQIHPFEKNSWYFRNALVRANYTNMNKGIYMNTEYLEKFFRNLLLGKLNELKNRYCHIKYNAKSTNKVTQKVTVNVTVKLTVNQKKILEEVKKNPFVTQEELAEIIGITRKSINENMKKLQSQKIIERIGADKNGHWEIIEK